MTKLRGFPFKVRPAAKLAGEDLEADPLPAHIQQDMKFCQAMTNAGYKLVELDEVTANK